MPAPTLDLAAVRTAIKNKIAGVAGIGVVHDYERYASQQAALRTLYKSAAQTGDRLYGWFVSRGRTREIYLATGRWVVTVNWRLAAYMSLDDADATEKKLDAQVELVRNAFRDDDALGGVVGTCTIDDTGNQVGVQVEEIDHVLFAGNLCHRARCSLATRIYLG